MSLEQEHIESSLDALLTEGLVKEVLYPVKAGKEATVYCCLAGPAAGAELVAAKVYRPREARNFRNDAIYQEGRGAAFSRRDRLAMEKKSRHGRDVHFGSWVAAEYETLRILRMAGADVPRPISQSNGVLLMEYYGDRGGAAPMLSQVSLPRPEALAAFKRIVRNVALWLRWDRIHADLSPFNILYWQGAPAAIDFPQAIDPRFNHAAQMLLRRDLQNVCRYFARAGVGADPDRIADQMWRGYRRAEL